MPDEQNSGNYWLDRMDQHLEEINDPVLLILKGHLLIEEVLFSKLKEQVSEPRYLIDARLRFSQLLSLARAFFSPDVRAEHKVDMDSTWDALKALSEIRNRLAHRLDNDDMCSQLRRFFVAYPYKNEPLSDPNLRGAINQTLGFLLGFASMLHK
jgi:hypothetical protein